MSDSITEPQAEAPAESAPGPTIDETMAAAYDAANPEEAAPAAPEPAAPEEGQARGPDGKFTAPEGAPAEPAAPVDAPAPSAVPAYIAPYEVDFAQRNMTAEKAIPQLLETWRRLEANPAQTLAWLAQQYGLQIAPPTPAGQAPAAEPTQQEWVDPTVAAIQAEVNQLKSRETERETQNRQAQAEAHNRAYAAVTTEVDAFAKSKAADGISFDALRPTMASLISSGQAKDLNEAYDMAVWAVPATRAAKIEADRKQSEATAIEENAKKAAAARRAGQLNVRSDVGIPGKGRTIEQSLERAYDEAQARA